MFEHIMEDTMDNLQGNITQNKTTGDIMDLVWYFLPTVATVPPLGLPANALVIHLLLRKPGICSTSEIFTLNLALFDVLFCVMVSAEYVNFLFRQTPEASKFLAWGLNQAGCPILLSILSLDSYVAVCHPLVFLRLKDPKLRLSLCSVVSVSTVVFCTLVKFSVEFKWNMVLLILSCAMVIISTCNILVLNSLRQSGPSKKEVHPVKKRAFKIVLTAFVLVNIHYLPPIAEYLLRQFGPGAFRRFSFATCVSYMALSVGSVIQPLSYLIRTKQLPKMRCHCSPAETKTVVTGQSGPMTQRSKCEGGAGV